MHSEAKQTEMEFGAEKVLLQGHAEIRWLMPWKALSSSKGFGKAFLKGRWYTMEYYSAIKWNKIGSFVEMWMDWPRECHTEWSKSEKEQQILHINAYMWILKKKWYRWSYFQSRNTDRDVENKYMDTKGERWRCHKLGDWDWHIYTIDPVCKIGN